MKLRQLVRRLRPSGWSGWPEKAYRRDRYQQRLLAVQEHLAECLDFALHSPVQILSICAGDGRDVIGVLRSHPRPKNAAAWLVELDRQSVAAGVRHATSVGLEHAVTFLNDDATDFATFTNIPPSDIVLVCGVWGHVPVAERARLVRALAAFCKPNGAAIWTRGLTLGLAQLREIQSQFVGPSWEEVRLQFTPDNRWGVATHRYRGPPVERPTSGRIFNFQCTAGH